MNGFKGFKKVSQDDECAIFQNDSGHEFKIAIAALSPKLKKELSSVPQYMKDGGVVEPKDDSLLKKGAKGYGEALKSFGNAIVDPYLETYDAVSQGAKDIGSGIKEGLGLKSEEEVLAPGNAPSPASLAPPAPASAQPQQMPPQQMVPMDQTQVPNASAGIQSAVNQQIKGINQEASAMGDLGKVEAQIAKEKEQAFIDLDKNYQARFSELKTENDNLSADYKAGQVNNNRYMESMSSGQKVRSAIGMVLSGIGSALAGQENMAENFLRRQIDRDIEAQKASLGKTENLLKFNQQKYGNLLDAQNVTKANLLGLYATQLEQAAALSKDPIAQARAMQAAGKLRAEIAPILQQTAQKQAVLDAVKSGKANPIMAIQAIVPKEFQDKAVEELGEYKKTQAALGEVDRIMGQFSDIGITDRIGATLGVTRDKVAQAKAALFPIAKTITKEAMQEADFNRQVVPFIPGMFSNSEKTRAESAQQIKNVLMAASPGSTAILSEYGLIPNPSKVKSFKPIGK